MSVSAGAADWAGGCDWAPTASGSASMASRPKAARKDKRFLTVVLLFSFRSKSLEAVPGGFPLHSF
jgi:hypothetical protein